MKALLSAAVDLCLLRLGPQHMPASPVLLGLLILLQLLLGSTLIAMGNITYSVALLERLFELGVLLGVVRGALKLAHKSRRFAQTAIALLLSGLLLELLALPLFLWHQQEARVHSALLIYLLLFWDILVEGSIVRHAFNVDLKIGFVASFLYTLVMLNLSSLLFPVAA